MRNVGICMWRLTVHVFHISERSLYENGQRMAQKGKQTNHWLSNNVTVVKIQRIWMDLPIDSWNFSRIFIHHFRAYHAKWSHTNHLKHFARGMMPEAYVKCTITAISTQTLIIYYMLLRSYGVLNKIKNGLSPMILIWLIHLFWALIRIHFPCLFVYTTRS